MAEAAVMESLERFLTRVARDVNESSLAERVVAQARGDEDEREALRQKVAKLEKAIAKHMRAHALDDDDDLAGAAEKEYRSVLNDLCSEKAGLEAQLAKHATEAQEDPLARRRSAARVAAGLLEEWDSLRPDRINFLLRKIIDKAVIHPDHRIDYHPTWAGGEVWTDHPSERVNKTGVIRDVLARMMAEGQPVTYRRLASEVRARGVEVSVAYVGVAVRRLREQSAGA